MFQIRYLQFVHIPRYYVTERNANVIKCLIDFDHYNTELVNVYSCCFKNF